MMEEQKPPYRIYSINLIIKKITTPVPTPKSPSKQRTQTSFGLVCKSIFSQCNTNPIASCAIHNEYKEQTTSSLFIDAFYIFEDLMWPHPFFFTFIKVKKLSTE